MMLLQVRCLVFYLILNSLIPPNISYIGTTYESNFLSTDPDFTSHDGNNEENGKSTNNEYSSTLYSKQRNDVTPSGTSKLTSAFRRTTEYYSAKKNTQSSSKNNTDAIVTPHPDITVTTPTVTNTIKPDVCAQYGTCDFVSDRSRVELMYCHCDELCQMYNDCCFDSDLKNKSRGVTKTQFECSYYSNVKPYFGIFVIKQCPDSFLGTDVENKCRSNDLITFGPWVVDEIGVVYQNKLCAECHGKKSYRLFSVKISNIDQGVINDNDTSVQRLHALINKEAKKTRRFDLVPPEGISVRHCFIYNSQSNNSTECLENSNNPVVVPSFEVPIFRNRYCVPIDVDEVYCLGPFVEDMSDKDNLYDFYPLSVLFVFTQTNNECRDSINGLCIGQQICRNFSIEFNMDLTTSVMLSLQETRNILLVFAWSLLNVVTPRNIYVQATDEVNNSSFSTRFRLQSVVDKDINAENMLEYESRLNKYHLHASVYATNRTFSASIARINDVKMSTFEWSVGPKELKSGLRNFNIDISTDDESRLFCIKRFVEIDFPDDSGVSVDSFKCLAEIQIGTTTDGNYIIKTVFTFVGMGLSVIALTVCIIIYRLAGLYTSVSGSNTENLCIALLLSNVLFLVGVGANDYAYVCYVVGVCLHYLWLSVFSFMSITLVHMLHVFMKMSSISYARQTSPDRRITILGLLLPTPFIISSLTLDFMKVPGFASNYDGSICFPTGYPASILFMSGPIGVSIAVNIVCFICTACIIKNQSQKSKLVRKSNSYQYISVYARISVVTGIFWITGVVEVLFQTEVVEYVFIILCSFQGCFVALANLTTKRVLRTIRNYFVVAQDNKT